MKFSKIIIFLLFLYLILVPSSLYYLYKNDNKNITILSPLPFFSQKVLSSTTTGFWQPKIDKVYDTGVKKPEITAESAMSYDLTTDKLLFSKNINKRLPIASLTKIMTAIVALENEGVDKQIKVSKQAAEVGEDSMGLSEDEVLTLKDLLFGLVLHSGNDAAEAIANDSKVGRNNFIYLMNRKAENLGLADTHFTNPSGLEGDGTQYSTAYDLLVMTRFAIINLKDFVPITSTYYYSIPQTPEHKAYDLYNETNLITSYPGVKGVKTGFTNEAGYCLVTYFEHGNHKIIAVLLNSDNRRQEMKDLLDYSLKTLGEKPPPHS